jgi:hypothetical protein
MEIEFLHHFFSLRLMRLLYACLLVPLMLTHAMAVDINRSKDTIPEKFVNPPGKRFSLFAGDPTRVQRANEVNLADFKSELNVEPGVLSLSNPTSGKGEPTTGIKITFKVQNIGKKKAYPLSFPDAQRYDIAVVGAADQMVYLWSQDKMFAEQADALFVNAGESLTYVETIPNAVFEKAGPGTYKIMVILANYPELKDTKEVTIQP